MLVDNTKNAVLEDTDISEVVRVKLTGEDYLKFNQLIPNLVLQKKIPDSAKKSYVSALGVQCFIQIMNVVTMAGKKIRARRC